MIVRPCVQFAIACFLALVSVPFASAYCYQFSTSTAALAVNISNLPAPTVTSDTAGDVYYTYDLRGLSGNSVTITIGGATFTASTFPIYPVYPQQAGTFSISIPLGPDTLTYFVLQVSYGDAQSLLEAQVTLAAGPAPNMPSSLLPNGLPPTLPPLSAWSAGASIVGLVETATIPFTQFPGNLDGIDSACSCTPGPSGMVSNATFVPQVNNQWC
jgi:hypothetical protein